MIKLAAPYAGAAAIAAMEAAIAAEHEEFSRTAPVPLKEPRPPEFPVSNVIYKRPPSQALFDKIQRLNVGAD